MIEHTAVVTKMQQQRNNKCNIDEGKCNNNATTNATTNEGIKKCQMIAKTKKGNFLKY